MASGSSAPRLRVCLHHDMRMRVRVYMCVVIVLREIILVCLRMCASIQRSPFSIRQADCMLVSSGYKILFGHQIVHTGMWVFALSWMCVTMHFSVSRTRVCVCVSIHMYVYVCIISLYHYHIAVLKGHWLIFVMCACMYIAKYYESPFFKPRGLECVCMSESMKVFTWTCCMRSICFLTAVYSYV